MKMNRIIYNDLMINKKVNWNNFDRKEFEIISLYLCDKCYRGGHALSSHMLSYVRRYQNESLDSFEEKYATWILSCKYAFDFRDKECFKNYHEIITDHGNLGASPGHGRERITGV